MAENNSEEKQVNWWELFGLIADIDQKQTGGSSFFAVLLPKFIVLKMD